MTYIQLSYGDLLLPALLVLMDGIFSLVLRLKLERQLAIATVRMVVQLVLVGYVLTFLFAAVSPLWTALAALIMVLFASREIVVRQKRRLSGVWKYGLGAGCTLLAAGTVTVFALLTELRPDPWYHPRYALPLLGMMLGNTMTGISLGLDVLTNSLVRERAGVEACLALGGTRHQALLPVIRDALRSGFMPIMNSMAAIGLVCQTLRDPMDCNLPGSSNHGIFQAMVLEGLPLPSPLHIWRNLKFIWSSGGNHLKSLHIV